MPFVRGDKALALDLCPLLENLAELIVLEQLTDTPCHELKRYEVLVNVTSLSKAQPAHLRGIRGHDEQTC